MGGRSMRVSRLILAAVIGGCASAPALSQTYDRPLTPQADREFRNPGDPHAPGYRCRGMSYGTGAQTCGTATGGPVGGITSRN